MTELFIPLEDGNELPGWFSIEDYNTVDKDIVVFPLSMCKERRGKYHFNKIPIGEDANYFFSLKSLMVKYDGSGFDLEMFVLTTPKRKNGLNGNLKALILKYRALAPIFQFETHE